MLFLLFAISSLLFLLSAVQFSVFVCCPVLCCFCCLLSSPLCIVSVVCSPVLYCFCCLQSSQGQRGDQRPLGEEHPLQTWRLLQLPWQICARWVSVSEQSLDAIMSPQRMVPLCWTVCEGFCSDYWWTITVIKDFVVTILVSLHYYFHQGLCNNCQWAVHEWFSSGLLISAWCICHDLWWIMYPALVVDLSWLLVDCVQGFCSDYYLSRISQWL